MRRASSLRFFRCCLAVGGTCAASGGTSQAASAPLVGFPNSGSPETYRFNAEIQGDIERAIVSFGDQPDSGLIVFPHPKTIANRKLISSLAMQNQLPAIYPYRYFSADGGLISYGPDQIDQWRGAAVYVNRILKGEKPAGLPVQTPTKYELSINL
jgi:putative ABC transport system substrate-binding protein